MSKHYKNDSIDSKKITGFKRSTLAVCIMAACGAQAQQQGGIVEEEVVVEGIRGSLQTSQELKRDASTVKDIITSADINAFPDKSVAEALQRLPGVNIERFAAADDPDHFSVEGSGVVVRGLTRTRSEFNGRDTFSADGSGGLNFSDVPPELLGSVEVVKNATASMIEGGIAGTVNLNTRKPFDKREQQIAITAKGSYGDLSEEFSPSLSGLYSNVWDLNNGGTIGFLISASASELNTRSDGVGLYNYYERSPVTGNAFNRFPDQAVFAPPAGSLRTQENERQRLGLTSSLQWANADEDITMTLEYVLSRSNLVWEEHYIEYSDQPFESGTRDGFQIGADAGGQVFSADANGVFQSGVINTPYGATGTRLNDGERTLSDLSLKFEFDLEDNLTLTTDLQWIKAENEVVDTFATVSFQHDTYLDLRDDVPVIEYINPSFNRLGSAPDETFWRSVLDHIEDNEGEQRTFSVDLDYTFDEGFFRAVKGGIRVAEREQISRNDNYANWGNISESWSGSGITSQISEIQANDPDLIESYQFDNFHRGDVIQGEDTFLFPSISAVSDAVALDRRLIEQGYATSNRVNLRDRSGVIPGTPFRPADISETEDSRSSAYFQVDFGFFATDSVEFRGNFGLRYVDYSWESIGSIGYADLLNNDAETLALIPPEELLFADGSSSDAVRVKGTDESKILPSLNVSAVINDQLIIRAAASQALFFPNLDDVSAQLQIGVAADFIEDDAGELVDVVIEQYTAGSSGGDGGSPFLKPEEADQFDLSFEWYFSDVGSLTTAFFYKEIDNIIRLGPTIIPATNNGIRRDVFTVGKSNFGEGTVKGVEVAYQQAFDFLPGFLSGFGTQINYTYIEQSGANDFDPEFNNQFASNGGVPSAAEQAFSVFTDLPLQGLSKDTINFVLFYETDTFDTRLAYNWRSSYLLNTRDVIAFAPVYSDATGQLDGSFNYRISDAITVGMEFNNILDEVTETQIQFNQEGTLTPRNYFLNDRRVSLTLRASF